MPLTLASPYIFRVKFNWSHDYIAMSEISSVEPLFYHPITKTYFVGAPEDPYLLSKFVAFLINYDIDTTLNKTNNLPAPNYPFLVDNMLYKLNEQVANFLREKYGGSAGGHKLAAGFSSDKDILELEKEIIQELQRGD